MNKKHILYIITFFSINYISAQQDLGLLTMSNTIPQQGFVNPAYVAPNKFNIGGDIAAGFYNNFGGISTSNNLIKVNTKGDNASFYANLDWNLFNIGFRVKENTYVSFSESIKSLNYSAMSAEGMQMFINGNAAYIGKTVNINPDLQLQNYNEFAVSLAHRFGKIQVGTKFKILNGITAITTGNKTLSLNTSDDVYQLTLNSDYELYTVPNKSINDLTDGTSDNSNFSIQSSGLALDLGAQINLNEKLTLGANLLNLGKLNWKGTSNKSKGIVNYDGVDASGVFSGDDDLDIAVNLDTLINKMKFVSTKDVNFKTSIPVTFNAFATYKINDKLNVSGVVSNTAFRGTSYLTLMANAQYKVLPFLYLGAGYGNKNGASMIGANLTLNAAAFQFYALTDNVLAVFKPINATVVNARVGINLRFGRKSIAKINAN